MVVKGGGMALICHSLLDRGVVSVSVRGAKVTTHKLLVQFGKQHLVILDAVLHLAAVPVNIISPRDPR